MSSLAKVRTASVVGIDPHPATVEVHIGRGLPGASVLGLADTAVRESRDRVKAAFESSGLSWPRGKITVNLAPADLPKAGASFDLPIASAVAAAAGIVPLDRLQDVVVVGELGLDGSVQRCRDVLPVALYCRSRGFKLICPIGNGWETSLIDGCEVLPVSDLKALVAYLRGESSPEGYAPGSEREAALREWGDGEDESTRDTELWGIVGQKSVIRGIAAAAAGTLNAFLWGPPGSGKTLLGRSAVSLLPDLDREASIEVRMIHCLVSERYAASLPRRPPLRSPHHTVSPAALVGGGPGIPRPGEVSLAHHGVLFLDELTLFSTASLEALRQPLEDGVVRIARSKTTVEYPARPMVVAATNTCPCGASPRSALSGAGEGCRCTDQERVKFLKRISGPLLERFDVAIQMTPPDATSLIAFDVRKDRPSWGSRVRDARRVLAERLGGYRALSSVPSRALGELLPLEPHARRLLEKWAVLQRASARRIHKMIRLSWALAALDGYSGPRSSHVEEAISLYVLPEELSAI